MDYEKKYKEALARAKEQLEGAKVFDYKEEQIAHDIRTTTYAIFPELAESEDEQIRKGIIKYLSWIKDRDGSYMPNNIPFDEMLDWLEKRGEQHSAIRWYDVSLIPQEMEELLVEWDSEDATWHEIAFYHADTKTFWNGTRQVENVTRWCYIIDLLEKQGEQKPTQEIEPFEAEHGKYYYCIKDYFCGGRKQASKGDVVQALRGLPIMGLKDASEYFLPVNSIKCNSAWSEEDEKFFKTALWHISYSISNGESTDIHCDTTEWLKSLKNRYTWKPSDEQMKCLSDVVHKAKYKNDISVGGYSAYMPLASLYLDLKKLREE